MINKEVNPVAKAFCKKYAESTSEVQREVDKLSDSDPRKYQFKIIKRKRVVPSTGDVFVFSPDEGLYFYGLVYESPIAHNNPKDWTHGHSLVFLFSEKTVELSVSRFIGDYSNLLIGPAVVHKSYWTNGYFFNVGNIVLQDRVKPDYGLIKIGIKKDKIVDCRGNELTRTPKILGIAGISTNTGIASQVQKELIFNPSLRKLDDGRK